uniref:ZP domain-containing protein n=1 Tax=Cuerna arida TaxID=1464854 RepID=A0A1B6GGK8_9HEMI
MLEKLLITTLLVSAWTVTSTTAKVQYKVRCLEDSMLVEIRKTEDVTDIYLDQLKHYPDPACQPHIDGTQASLLLSLDNVFQCGVTRVVNQLTGVQTYYHSIVIETTNEKNTKEIIPVKCVVAPPAATNHTLLKRNVLPAGFQEPEHLEITTSVVERAPQPVLKVGVRQGGQLVSGELNVNPGTPLQMEIYLDKESAPIYGLLVSYMQVTDTKTQEETIIFNGCSMDPYLFENFNTVDGDFLTAKFRAFKFPESTYVQFKGTVNVCLDKCRGVECSNGQLGYGRRRREVRSMPPDPNKVFEITISSFYKVNYKEESLLEKVQLSPTMEKKVGGSPVMSSNNVVDDNSQQHLQLDTEEIHEDLHYTIIEDKSSGSVLSPGTLLILCLSAAVLRRQ